LVKAEELRVSFGFDENWWRIYGGRYPIRNLLQEEKGRRNLIRGLQDTGIFFVEQLLDQSGKNMVTWQQVMLARDKVRRGKRPKWFTVVESKLLQDRNRRVVKEEWIGDANNMYTLRIVSKEVSCNNRKKEWILLRGKENEPVVKKIIEKRRCKVLTENWKLVKDTESLKKSPIKGFRCMEKQEEDGSSGSLKWVPKSRILSCLPRPVVKEGKRFCLIPTDMLEEMVRSETPTSKGKEHVVEDVVIEDIDVEMIRQQKMGREMEETLEQQLQNNRERDSNILWFYTDGSLRFIEGGSKMGAGWVQVDSEGKLCLAEGRCRIEAWPSSTKPELVAIWLALLTVPSNSKVVIRTDSLEAIAGLSKDLELCEVKK